jgi:hypothetical protein
MEKSTAQRVVSQTFKPALARDAIRVIDRGRAQSQDFR